MGKMFSKSVKGTSSKSTKLNWWQYWIGHCWMTGWQTIGINFRMWADLMGGNYQNYALLKQDDPLSECIEWFWVSLNEDDTYPKQFLEELMQMVEDIDSGKIETYSVGEDLFDRMKDLVGDLLEDEE